MDLNIKYMDLNVESGYILNRHTNMDLNIERGYMLFVNKNGYGGASAGRHIHGSLIDFGSIYITAFRQVGHSVI